MGPGVETRVGNGDRWITLHNFNRLLNTLATSNSFASLDASASDSLFVAFGVSRTDAVHLYKWYVDRNGAAPSISASGPYALRVVSPDGEILSTTSFTPDFRRFSDEVEERNWSTILLTVPYPANASRVVLVKGDVVLATIHPQTKLL